MLSPRCRRDSRRDYRSKRPALDRVKIRKLGGGVHFDSWASVWTDIRVGFPFGTRDYNTAADLISEVCELLVGCGVSGLEVRKGVRLTCLGLCVWFMRMIEDVAVRRDWG